MKSLYQLAKSRRSVRKYTNEPVTDDAIRRILSVALTAPNSFGHRPVEYIVVRDPQRIRALAACKTMGGRMIIGAGAVIVVMAELSWGEFWVEDAAAASAYLLLAIEEEGLGACWVQIRNRMGQKATSDEEIRTLLGVPENYGVLNLIALGGKGEDPPPYTEADLDANKIHFETF